MYLYLRLEGAEGAIEVAEQVFAAMPDFAQRAANCETNADTHDLTRALQASSSACTSDLSEALVSR